MLAVLIFYRGLIIITVYLVNAQMAFIRYHAFFMVLFKGKKKNHSYIFFRTRFIYLLFPFIFIQDLRFIYLFTFFFGIFCLKVGFGLFEILDNISLTRVYQKTYLLSSNFSFKAW